MARNVAIGIQSFEDIIKDNCFYIDAETLNCNSFYIFWNYDN